MLYTHKIEMDINQLAARKRISIAYGSKNSNTVEITLYDGSSDTPWMIPQGAACVIRYMKADAHGGIYHALEDGGNAWSIADNKLTVTLIPEVLDVPGLVDVSVMLTKNSSVLGIYGFDVHMVKNDMIPVAETSDYFSYENMEQITAAFASIQAKIETDCTLSLDGQPADAAAVGTALDGKLPGIENPSAPGTYYRENNGETVWLNPVMALGVEYLTPEYWLGNKLYTKIVNCEAVPASGDSAKYIHCGVTNARIVRCAGRLSNGYTVPMIKDGISITVMGSNEFIQIYNTSAAVDLTAYTATVQIWYYKE